MELSDLSGVGDKTLTTLNSHEINTISQLLNYYPRTYRTYHLTNTKNLVEGEWVSLVGTLSRPVSHHTGRVNTQISSFKDELGTLTLRWFNSPFITRSVNPESSYLVRGRIEVFNNRPQIVNPELKKIAPGISPPPLEILPIYSPLGTLKSGHIRNLIKSALATDVVDQLPSHIKSKFNLLDLPNALSHIHLPSSETDLKNAIHRLSFDELLALQLESLHNSELNKQIADPLAWDTVELENWLTSLPFTLTPSQKTVIEEILSDLKLPTAMHRLLAGEVGSGKTLVAITVALATTLAGKRVVLMAPTQILAEQLYQNFAKFLPRSVSLSLLTGTAKGDLRADILVGTQAILSHIPKLKNIGLIIIDEQHRFGVKQREALSALSPTPHFLMMTATPIPRTLAHTLFFGSTISRLTDLPSNRLPVKTYFIEETKRASAYTWIREEIRNRHNRVFIVVPLIELAENNEESPAKSIKELEGSLHQSLPGVKIDFLHGKMKPSEKTAKLLAFREGATDVLVATSMIEVGIDVPEANIMIIENAEFFGLATLHQLRGRVGRGGGQGHCFLFTPNLTDKVKSRLSYFIKERDGAKLAEYDLGSRGPGELFGESQHGFFNLKLGSIYDTQLLRETALAAKILSI